MENTTTALMAAAAASHDITATGVSSRLARWLEANVPATPCLVLDLDVVAAAYGALAEALPRAAIFYAVKANPHPAILRRLVRLGSGFDAASPAEIDMCLEAGAAPERISYGSTLKKAEAIAHAHAAGVRLYAYDCEEEMRKIAVHAPGAEVYGRLRVDNEGAEWPLSQKFGCGAGEGIRLARLAADLGLVPVGFSFHVGSQQKAPQAWAPAIARAATCLRLLAEEGYPMRLINIGGGLPGPDAAGTKAPDLPAFAAAISRALDHSLAGFPGGVAPQVMIEPGRGLVAAAGVIETEVVLATRREDGRRWVYIDAGRFGGLAETEGEAIRYAIEAADPARAAEMREPAVLAGPSCDSVDTLYEKTPYPLPSGLRAGDRLRIAGAGAYTTTYASIGFNGFGPLIEHVIGEEG